MPARLPIPAWVAPAALSATLLPLLSACGPARNEFAPLCPGQAILGDASDLAIWRPSGGPPGAYDLTDLVLYGRVIGMQGTCREGDRKNQLAVSVNVGVELTRGPAMPGRESEVPVFIAVTEGDIILDKRFFTMRVVFPSNVDRVTLGGGAEVVLPVTAAKSGAAYTLVTGFQLTPDQMTDARRGRRP